MCEKLWCVVATEEKADPARERGRRWKALATVCRWGEASDECKDAIESGMYAEVAVYAGRENSQIRRAYTWTGSGIDCFVSLMEFACPEGEARGCAVSAIRAERDRDAEAIRGEVEFIVK